MRRIPAALALLLAIGAVLGVAWAVLLPPLQGPDESAHIAAITSLVEDGSLVGAPPGLPREVLVLAREGGLGPLIGNRDARPAWTDADRARVDRALDALGSRRAEFVSESGPPTRGTARNPPLYTAYQAVPYVLARGASLPDRLLLMRLFNVPLLLVTITACWLLAAELLPRAGLAPVLAGGVAALQPELAFITGAINPDVLLVAITSAFCLMVARLVRRGPSVGRIAWLVALTGAGLATHARGVALLPCAALAIAVALPWSTMSRAARRRAAALLASGVAVVAALAVAIAGAAGINVSGTALGATGASFSPRQFVSYVWQFYLPRLPFMDPPVGGHYGIRQAGIETTWGTFASLEVSFPDWVFTALIAVLAAAAVAGVVAAVRGPRSATGVRVALVFAALVVFTLGELHVAAYRLLLVDPSDPVIVGRQLLIFVAPLTLGLAYAVTSYARAAPWVTAAALGGLAALDLAALGLTAARFYG